MDFFTAWLILTPIAVGMLTFTVWWDLRRDPCFQFTLFDLFISIGMCLLPIFQAILIVWVFFAIADRLPAIVLFEGKSKGTAGSEDKDRSEE